jgi:hypothetical protein
MVYIDSNTSIDQSFADDSSNWPVTIAGEITITFAENLTFNSANQYFIIGGPNVTIDGKNKIIKFMEITDYPGLFQNGTETTNGYENITIEKLGIIQNGGTLLPYAKWFFQNHFSNKNQPTI